jgi:hypothetical protein
LPIDETRAVSSLARWAWTQSMTRLIRRGDAMTSANLALFGEDGPCVDNEPPPTGDISRRERNLYTLRAVERYVR